MNCNKITFFRDGVSQQRRSLLALDPASVKMVDREIGDLLIIASQIAKQFAFYNSSNQHNGDWSTFIPEADLKMLEMLANELLITEENELNKFDNKNIPAHLSLFLTFLLLSEYTKPKINNLPHRQLDYFFTNILGFKAKPGTPDKAHVIIEINNTESVFKIEKGDMFWAGKGFNQQGLVYESEREAIINRAKIVDWRTSFKVINNNNTNIFTTTIGTPDFIDAVPWNLFSDGRLTHGGLKTTFAQIGWAIESPALYLQEAEREIEVVITTSGTPVLPKRSISIDAFITSESGWMQVQVKSGIYENNSITIKLGINASQPPAVTNKDLFPNLYVQWPVLKIALKDGLENTLYQYLTNNSVIDVLISVDVLGYKNMTLFNPDGVVNAGAPINAFGVNPSPGTRLIMGVNELRYKNINGLSIDYKWKNAPAEIGEYYLEYFYDVNKSRPQASLIDNINTYFSGIIELLQEGRWKSIDNINLFPSGSNLSGVKWESINANPGLNIVKFPMEGRQNGPTELLGPKNFPQNGYLSIQFNKLINNTGGYFSPIAFGREEYPQILSEIAIGKVTPSTAVKYSSIDMPNAPYNPSMSYLTVDYSAYESFQPKLSDKVNRFYHLAPFGIYEPDGVNDKITVVPLHIQNGILYLGLENLNPPQNVTILFQLEEGTGDPAVEPGNMAWAYLSGDKWVNLDVQRVVFDQTSKLKTSGIVEVSIPIDASINHSIMPSGLHWLQLAIENNLSGLNKILDLYTQVISVVYTGDLSNKPRQLPPGSIKNLLNNNPSIKKIIQPYDSFGGMMGEQEKEVIQRAQERLRHRDRALSYWDFERLTLERFSEIYKVKCIPCSDGKKNAQPGEVALYVVPEQRGKRILTPRNSPLLLERIQMFMQSKAQSGLTLHVLNPEYEPVLFDFKVSFFPGLDPGYYQQLLNEELQSFVSPWAFDDRNEIFFGNTIYRSEVIKFIESREYVDFIINFEMYSKGGEMACFGIGDMKIAGPTSLPESDDFTIDDLYTPGISKNGIDGGMVIGDNFVVGMPVNIASVSQPSGILVSSPIHRVRLIDPGAIRCAPNVNTLGIGTLAIEIDFDIL
jgi:hypothetical protein